LPDDNLELCAKNYPEPITTDGFFDALDATAITPFVDFSAEVIRFLFEKAEFSGCEETVTS
jgi:hypothetical protein